MKIPAFFDSLIPRPRVGADSFRPKRPIKRIIVFVRMPIRRSTIFSRAESAAQECRQRMSWTLPAARCQMDPDGAFVIFCRYANHASLDWVKHNANRLAGVGLFIDDDLAAWLTSPDVPVGYRFYLAHHGVLPLFRLNRYLDCVWTSTAALARSIGEEHAIVLPPAPRASDFASDRRERDAGPIRIVFKAEYHSAEHQFLLPVVAKVLERRPEVKISVTEISTICVGVAQTARCYGFAIQAMAGVSRLYRRQSGRHRAGAVVAGSDQRSAVGNQAHRYCPYGCSRSFSRSSVFEDDAEPGEIFLPNDRDAWVDGIVRLIDDPALRTRAAAATRLAVERLAAAAVSFPGLGECG